MRSYIHLFVTLFLAFSCAKPEPVQDPRSDEVRRIESINVVRTEMNVRTAAKNAADRFEDLSGSHQLRFSSDETSSFTGKIFFSKTGRDRYSVKGNAVAANNHLNIEGTITRVSVKHLNFDGVMRQTINQKRYTRSGKSTFFKETEGKFWRLQDKVNGSGFVEYIDIYF